MSVIPKAQFVPRQSGRYAIVDGEKYAVILKSYLEHHPHFAESIEDDEIDWFEDFEKALKERDFVAACRAPGRSRRRPQPVPSRTGHPDPRYTAPAFPAGACSTAFARLTSGRHAASCSRRRA